ncbi:unnamed protein product [Callosobruchus maculatus]|uniref:Peroxin-19 n=1 Tax=Callosobruchus maculatus TaxID=64391 RepID=A0A653DPX2_CALMS|nr:unnamed protein product [Callosobruchus maculatus]
MSDEKKDESKKVDEDLSSLLDSALEDFSKTDKSKDAAKPEGETKETTSEVSCLPESQEWSADFVKQAAKEFEDNFASLLASGNPNAHISPEVIQEKLQQVADAAQHILANPTEVTDPSSDYAASISEAIRGLSAGAEGLQAPLNEEDLLKMFEGSGSTNDLLPFMQGMMQGLLSKEVLGPSLQDFVEKFPEYIEKNKATLSPADVERYQKQKTLMEEVLTELNKESESDSNDVKKERFTKVLGLMQKLQDYGQPPPELVGDVEAPFQFDVQGNPVPNPAMNSECNIM